MKCPKCNGDMIGDGYSQVEHCEFANVDDYAFVECDAGPIYCSHVEPGIDDEEELQF